MGIILALLQHVDEKEVEELVGRLAYYEILYNYCRPPSLFIVMPTPPRPQIYVDIEEYNKHVRECIEYENEPYFECEVDDLNEKMIKYKDIPVAIGMRSNCSVDMEIMPDKDEMGMSIYCDNKYVDYFELIYNYSTRNTASISAKKIDGLYWLLKDIGATADLLLAIADYIEKHHSDNFMATIFRHLHRLITALANEKVLEKIEDTNYNEMVDKRISERIARAIETFRRVKSGAEGVEALSMNITDTPPVTLRDVVYYIISEYKGLKLQYDDRNIKRILNVSKWCFSRPDRAIKYYRSVEAVAETAKRLGYRVEN